MIISKVRQPSCRLRSIQHQDYSVARPLFHSFEPAKQTMRCRHHVTWRQPIKRTHRCPTAGHVTLQTENHFKSILWLNSWFTRDRVGGAPFPDCGGGGAGNSTPGPALSSPRRPSFGQVQWNFVRNQIAIKLIWSARALSITLDFYAGRSRARWALHPKSFDCGSIRWHGRQQNPNCCRDDKRWRQSPTWDSRNRRSTVQSECGDVSNGVNLKTILSQNQWLNWRNRFGEERWRNKRNLNI